MKLKYNVFERKKTEEGCRHNDYLFVKAAAPSITYSASNLAILAVRDAFSRSISLVTVPSFSAR